MPTLKRSYANDYNSIDACNPGDSSRFLVKTRAVTDFQERDLSTDRRRVEQVLAIIRTLAAEDNRQVSPGDVADQLRADNWPVPVWQLRADFTQLAEEGLIELDSKTARWVLAAEQSLKDTG